MKWKVSGKWDFDDRPGSVTVEAGSMRLAFDEAKRQGLTASEAIVASDIAAAKSAAPAAASGPRSVINALGVSSLIGWLLTCALIIGGGRDPVLYACGTVLFLLGVVLLVAGMILKRAG